MCREAAVLLLATHAHHFVEAPDGPREWCTPCAGADGFACPVDEAPVGQVPPGRLGERPGLRGVLPYLDPAHESRQHLEGTHQEISWLRVHVLDGGMHGMRDSLARLGARLFVEGSFQASSDLREALPEGGRQVSAPVREVGSAEVVGQECIGGGEKSRGAALVLPLHPSDDEPLGLGCPSEPGDAVDVLTADVGF